MKEDSLCNDFDKSEVHVAELQVGPLYICACLKLVKGKEKLNLTSYESQSFDITEANQIFDVLLKDKQIILPKGKKMPFIREVKNRKFCKFHQIVGYSTNSCVCFKDLIQKAT